MKTKEMMLAAMFAAAAAWTAEVPTAGQAEALAAPGFHHLHLNSTNSDAALAFYTKAFPSTSKTTWGGLPALKSPNNVLVLFTKVDQPAATQPQSAMWHFGWQVTNERQALDRLKADSAALLPLYTTDEGGTVSISSDTWPGTGGALGLTKPQIADARAKGVKPVGRGGFGYLRGPDDALIEFSGDGPAERFNHVHMYQDDPFCAQLWYGKHLNAPVRPGLPAREPPTEANCKVARGVDTTWPALDVGGMYRTPSSGVVFGDVAVIWYMRQSDRPLAHTRGHLADHFALRVANLDAWIAKLRAGNVTFLEQPYKLGDTRAVLIEGPSREAIELVEAK